MAAAAVLAAGRRAARGAPPEGGRRLRRRVVSRDGEDFTSLANMKKDLKALQSNPAPRGGKRVGSQVWFEMTLGLPLGLRLDDAPAGDSVGVGQVLPGGSAEAHNQKHIYEKDGASERENFIQVNDRLMSVNGTMVNSQAAAVEIITSAADPQNLKLRFSRERASFITVVFPDRTPVPVPQKSFLYKAAEAVEHPVEFNCSNGSCGSCWRLNDRTGEIYVLCQDVLACDIPSEFKGAAEPLFAVAGQDEDEGSPEFDNTEPLFLQPCPEVYEQFAARWKAEGKI